MIEFEAFRDQKHEVEEEAEGLASRRSPWVSRHPNTRLGKNVGHGIKWTFLT